MTIDFGELRSLLHQSNKDSDWRATMWQLLDNAYSEDPETYQAHWLPHLLSTPAHFWSESIKHFYKLDELERAHQIAPFALFRFSNRIEPLAELLQTPGVHQLDDLSLWIPEIKPGEITTLVQTCTKLKSLMLGCCRSSEQGLLPPEFVEELVQTQPLEHLKTLNLQSNKLKTDSMKILAQSKYLPALKNLILFENQFDHTSIDAMRDAPWLPQLTMLELSSNGLEEEGVETLLTIDRFDQLQDLGLELNNIRDEGCEVLAQSTNLTTLTNLDLSQNSIGLYGNNEGIAALSQSVGFPNLESLTLNENHIKDDGLRHLAGAQHFHRLRRLSVDENDINGPGLLDLARAPWINQLEYLSVQTNEYADEYIAFEHYSAFVGALGAHAENITLNIGYEKPEWMYVIEDPNERDFDPSEFILDDNDYELLSQHPKFKEIKSLDLSEANPTTHQLQILFGSGCLEHLEELSIDSVALPSNGPEALSRMTHLQLLSLYDVQLDDATLHKILHKAHWPHLHTLNIGLNNLTEQTFKNLNQKDLPALRAMTLWEMKCSMADFIQYLQQTPVTYFEEILFDESAITHENASPNPRTKPLHIDSLNLDSCGLSDLHITTLTKNLQNITISDLQLDWNDIGPKGAIELANCTQLQNTTTLNLRGNAILDEGFEAIVKSPYLSNLESMTLFANMGLTSAACSGLRGITRKWREVYCDLPMDSDGFEMLFDLCPDLETLTLYKKSVAAMDVLANKQSTKLQKLRLNGVINATNLEMLLRASWIDQLKHLHISDSHITPEMAQHIAHCNALQTLETFTFHSSKIEDAAKGIIKQSPYLSEQIKRRLFW